MTKQKEESSTDAWRVWLDQLANHKIVPDVGLRHALIDYRTVHAGDASRKIGEFLVYLVTKGLIDTPPPSITVTARHAAEYLDYRQGRKKNTSKASELIGDATRADGSLDMDQLVAAYMATSQKRTTQMAVYYHLGELNKEWQEEFARRLPLPV